MIGDYMNEIWIVLMCVILASSRFVLEKMIDTTSTKVRFLMGLILMVMYTVFMMGTIYSVYQDTINRAWGLDKFYQSVMVDIATINFALMLVAVLYYFMRKKRKISDLDKIKLRDF